MLEGLDRSSIDRSNTKDEEDGEGSMWGRSTEGARKRRTVRWWMGDKSMASGGGGEKGGAKRGKEDKVRGKDGWQL